MTMKQSIFKFFIVLMAISSTMWLTSCTTEDDPKKEETNEFLPVLDDNFSYTIDGNDVNFTTTITGNVWVTTGGVDYPFTDKKVKVNLPNADTYSFTCSSLGSGSVLTSAAFDIVMETSDLAFLNEGYWKSLSGGANKTKTWKMDLNAEGKSVYFAGPLYYSGADSDPYWAWDVLPEDFPVTVGGTEMTGYFNWTPDYPGNTWLMAANNYGTITFNGTNGTVSTSVFGETSEGSFAFDPETLKITLSGVTPPIDTARVNEGQFLDEDLHNVKLFSLTDSSMQIGIKRSYEGFAEDGVTPNESKWVQVYNFIVDGYDYPVPEEFTYSEPVKTSLTTTDLAGTWKLAAVPGDWVGWTGNGDQGTTKDAVPLNGWADAAAMIGTEWFGITQAQLDAAYAQTYVFGNDGSTNINGTATTYTLDAGVLTFADSVTFALADHWFAVKVKSIKALEVPGNDGLWFGNQNESKPESQAFHLLKQ